MLTQALIAARDIGRMRDIASVMVKYGFGDLVGRIGLGGLLERAGHMLHSTQIEEAAQLPPAVRVRRALEELGPTFVKLGQVFSTRVDLFPADWIAEFERLQNQVPSVPFAEIHAQLEEDLGMPPETAFAEIDPVPLAAASIAQVHRAILHDGTDVIVKVRRPGIETIVEADLRLLKRLATVMEAESPDLRRFQPQVLVRHFRNSLLRELDLASECRNAERIAASFAAHPEIVIPKVYWSWTSERVNVQARIVGIPAGDVDAMDAAGIDRKVVARYGAQIVLKMMFEDGFFHADPHPGNVFFLPGNKLALIDFGMVGHLSDARRHQLIDLMHALVRRDAIRCADVLTDWTDDASPDKFEALVEDLEAFLDRFHGVPLKQLSLGGMLGDIASILRDHHLALPPELAMVMKVFVTLEGMGRKLDPDFDMASEAAPFVRREMLARHSPEAILRRFGKSSRQALTLLESLPADLASLVRRIRHGELRVKFDVERLGHVGDQVAHSANRLTVGIVIAALIVGSSIVMTVEGGPTLLGLPLFGLAGFLCSVLGSIWLLFSIWRSGGGK